MCAWRWVKHLTTGSVAARPPPWERSEHPPAGSVRLCSSHLLILLLCERQKLALKLFPAAFLVPAERFAFDSRRIQWGASSRGKWCMAPDHTQPQHCGLWGTPHTCASDAPALA